MLRIVDTLDGRVLRKRRDGSEPGLVVLDHVDGGLQRYWHEAGFGDSKTDLQSLLVHGWGERGSLGEADEDANIHELILVHAELVHYAALGEVLEGRVRGGEVERGDQLVHAGVEERLGRPIDRVDVSLRVPLEVDKLRSAKYTSAKTRIR